MRLSLNLLALVFLGWAVPDASHAQAGGAGTLQVGDTVPRVVALVARVPSIDKPGHRAMVIRRPELLPQNVILVAANATPADLASALWTLVAMVQMGGVDVDVEERRYVPPSGQRHGPRRLAEARWLLDQIDLVEPWDIPGIGTYPTTVATTPYARIAAPWRPSTPGEP